MLLRQLPICQMMKWGGGGGGKSHFCVNMASKILKYLLSFEMLLEGKRRLIKN